MSGLIISQPPFPFQVWPDLKWNQDSADRPGELLRHLTCLYFLLLPLGRLFFLALPFLLKPAFFYYGVHPLLSMFPLWSPSFSSRCGSRSPWLSAPYDLVLWTDGFISFPFGEGGSGVLTNCSLCNTEATLSFSAGPVSSSFSSEAWAIVQAFC